MAESVHVRAQRRLTFLVVEDDPFQRGMIVKMLAALGAAEIKEAGNGAAAIEMLESLSLSPDIVVSDLDMPGIDGMELIRWISVHAEGAALIVASAMQAELLASVEAMAAAYGVHLLGSIQKPVTRRKLQELIDRYDTAHGALAGREPPSTAFNADAILQGLQKRQFEAYFQPQIALESGKVVGFEALARWRHPEEGVLAPAFFVPKLEQMQEIDALLFCMLRKAAQFRRAVATAGECMVSVNVSLASLTNLQIGERVREIVSDEGVEPKAIVLEVTESAATTDIGHVLENLTRLRMKGFELSIDDYGTGYSSLEQLTRVPFSEVKIDQTFVIPAIRKPSARIILQSSLNMARKLGLRTVAEGVESRDHLELLAKLGCGIAQGYYFAHPMSFDACLAWLRNRTSRRRRSSKP
jgi:EAL domain-containing protein (putative c-di-GMP-specific phosphodiesterase class I)/CheY-like chemotaxis protein